MRVEWLRIAGAALTWPDIHSDERGSFRRAVDVSTMTASGMLADVSQISVATNPDTGTVRALHWQARPHEEAKTVWCTSGAVFDVFVDLRADQPTYGTWQSVELSADNGASLHLPRGVAHGYQTLAPDTVMSYLVSTPYDAQSARGLRWDDPFLAIPWPLPVSRISERDRTAPLWPPS